MDSSLPPMERIEDWRRQMSNYAAVDRVGHVMSKTLEVLKCLVQDHVSYADLEIALESLDMENSFVKKHDKSRSSDAFRNLVFGLIESVFAAGSAIYEKKSLKEKQDEVAPIGDLSTSISVRPPSPAAEPTSSTFDRIKDSLSTQDFYPVASGRAIIKEEDDISLGSYGGYPEERGTSWDPYAQQQQQHDFQQPSSSQQTALFMSPPPAPATNEYTGGRLEVPSPKYTLQDNAFRCNLCGATFRTYLQIENHVRDHDSAVAVKGYECPECGKTFSKKQKLRHHIASHSADGEKSKFPCSYCGQKFTDRSNLRRHIRKQHEAQTCAECGCQTRDQKEFREHMATHHQHHVHPHHMQPDSRLPPSAINMLAQLQGESTKMED